MLSAIIICKNEERHIRACLESVSFADEIIVVDSGSTDKTVEICWEFTPHVYFQEWLGMNKQKAFALTKAKGDWVINIDADERITPELASEIREILGKMPNEAGFLVPRKAWYLGKWLRFGGWIPDLKLRLFQRHKATWTGVDPHDTVTVSGPTRKLRSPMLHYSFEDLSAHWDSINRYSSIAAREMVRREKPSNLIIISFHTVFSFFKSFCLKGGILEGPRGLIQAMMISAGVMLKYAKTWELRHTQQENEMTGDKRGTIDTPFP